MTAAQDRDAYAKAMAEGLHDVCMAIEKRYDLFGYPPYLVSIGLAAACEGRDALNAVEAHLDGCQE